MIDRSISTERPQERVIRVFVSSTFRDMQAEREELVKRVFPQLRKLCEERGVAFVDVDLRWGVTDEEAAEGKVLPICLAEIERCRPFFIGLLGQRYGWIPQHIPDELIESQSWLAEHREKSVTELEILHGVLNNPDMANRAIFYFRDPAYLDRIPVEQRADFIEDDQNLRDKLQALLDRIHASDLAWHDNYPDPQTLGQWVLDDLTVAINQMYPPGKVPDPLDRDAAEHDAFARSRTGVYIGRQEYFDRLDEHAAGDGPPLVVLGESGSGKSALLANWALRYRREHPDALVLLHFIGSTPYSADWAAMLRRIMGELKRRFDIRQEIPDKPDALRAAFANWLHMAAAQGRVVLVLDALNQLEDRDGAPDLVWLPPAIPSNVRMVLSTLPSRPFDELRKRGWPAMEVKPLTPDERKQLIEDYLAQYTKHLRPDRAERIALAPQAANPLYLRALLEELRVFGVHEELDTRIGHYLSAETASALYEKILARWEEDYDRDRPGLVRDAMTALWAARRGLAESELLELLGADGRPLARAHWSPLYLAAEFSLVVRSGLIGFFHDYLREAVRRRYLSDDPSQQAVHLRMADYFEARDFGRRRIDELPWQLAKAGSWRRLFGLLCSLPFFKAAWEEMGQFEVKAHWARLEAQSPLQMVDGYRSVIESPHHHPDSVWNIAMLLADTGHQAEAGLLRGYLVEHFRATGDLANLQAALGSQAGILYARGDLDEAMRLHKQQEQICRETGNKDGLQRTLGDQAVILYTRGDLDGAMQLHNEGEQICRELGNKDGLWASLCNQASILKVRGDLDEAMRLHKQQEQICRELGNKNGLSIALAGQANILYTRGDLDEAMRLHKQQEQICRETGNKDGLSKALVGQANIFYTRGDLDEAMRLHKQQEQICRELGNKDGLSTSLGNQGLILYARGDLDGAMRLHKQEERICRELGNKDGLQRTLCNQALILKARGDLDEAMQLHKQQEQICRVLGNKDGLQVSLCNQASILYARGDLDGAMQFFNQQEQICRELGNKDGLSIALAGQANALYARGSLDGAMQLYNQQEQICREMGNKNGLSIALAGQANVLYARGDLDGAVHLYQETERICREMGNKDALSKALIGQANIFYTRGDLDEAMRLHKQQEQICREMRNKDGLSTSLGNQGLILYARGDLDGAMRLHKQQEQICREMGNKDGLQRTLCNQASILYARGDLDGAMQLYNQQEIICHEMGNNNGLSFALAGQANVLYVRRDLDGAVHLYQEAERICREMGNKDGLWRALYSQAYILFCERNDAAAARPKCEEAIAILIDTKLAPDVLAQARSMLARIMARL